LLALRRTDSTPDDQRFRQEQRHKTTHEGRKKP
jgi:hypothetical protein